MINEIISEIQPILAEYLTRHTEIKVVYERVVRHTFLTFFEEGFKK